MNDWDEEKDQSGALKGPAMGLIVFCVIALAIQALGLASNGLQAISGAEAEGSEIGGLSPEAQRTFRLVWGIILIASNVLILRGALRMRKLEDYRGARLACVLAMIPCLGPCLIMGIPFGIWGFVVLGKDEVRQAFRS